MKKLSFLILFGFLANFGFAQSAPLIPSTKITINSVTVFTDPYTVVGTTNDVTSNWTASDISAGDSVYLEDGNELRVYYVQSITSASGTNFTIVINDMNNTGNIPPTGVGALYRGTVNYDFPNFTAGISESLQTLIQNRFVQRLDTLLKGLGADYITTDSFSTFTNGATFASIPIGKTVWRTTTGSLFEKISSTSMLRRSTDDGENARLGFTQSGNTLLFNANLHNKVRLSSGNISSATIQKPSNYLIQETGENFLIGITTGNTALTVTWDTIYGSFNGTTFTQMPSTILGQNSTVYFKFRVINPASEQTKFQYVDGTGSSSAVEAPSTLTQDSVFVGIGTDSIFTGLTENVIPRPIGWAGTQIFSPIKNNDGTISINSNFAKSAHPWISSATSKNIYVSKAGSDSNNGLTSGAAKATIQGALAVMTTGDTLRIGKGRYYKNQSFNNLILDSLRYCIVGDYTFGTGDSVYVTLDIINQAGTWTLESGNVYKATLPTTPFYVSDNAFNDAYGDPKWLTQQSSIATVQANPGSWWYNSGTLYIRTENNRIPDADIAAIDQTTPQVRIRNNTQIAIHKINFVGGGVYVDPVDHVSVNDIEVGIYDCSLLGSSIAYYAKGKLVIGNVKIRGTECDDLISIDGFVNATPNVYIYNTRGYNTGQNGCSAPDAQAFTTHKNVIVHEVNNIWGGGIEGQPVACVGGVLAGVPHGAMYWAVGSTAQGSLGTAPSANWLFGTGVNTSYAWLDECRSNNTPVGGFDIDESSPADVKIRRFTGLTASNGTPTQMLPQSYPDSIPIAQIEGISELSHDSYFKNRNKRALVSEYALALAFARATPLPAGTGNAHLYFNNTTSQWAVNNQFNFVDGGSTSDDFFGLFHNVPNAALHMKGNKNNLYFKAEPTVAGVPHGIWLENHLGQDWFLSTNSTERSGEFVFNFGGSSGSLPGMAMRIERTAGKIGFNTGLNGVALKTLDKQLTVMGASPSASSPAIMSQWIPYTSGSAAPGFGVMHEDYGPNRLNVDYIMGRHGSIVTDTTNASKDTKFSMEAVTNNTLSEVGFVSGTQAKFGNMRFNVDQTIGAGQDNFVLTYDNATNEIGLEAVTGSGDNLGNHSATQALDMNSFAINEARQINGADLLLTSTDTTKISGSTSFIELISGFARLWVAGSKVQEWNQSDLSFIGKVPDNLPGAYILEGTDGNDYININSSNTATRMVLGSSEAGAAIGFQGIRYEDVQAITATGTFTAEKSTITVNLASTGTVTANLTGWPTSASVGSVFTIINTDAVGSGVDVTVALTGATWHSGSNPVLTPGQSVNAKLIAGVLYPI